MYFEGYRQKRTVMTVAEEGRGRGRDLSVTVITV
jgi:hypothetical protein